MQIDDTLRKRIQPIKDDVEDMAGRLFNKQSHAENGAEERKFKLELYKHRLPDLDWTDESLLMEVNLNG
jgi:hypothetical protein